MSNGLADLQKKIAEEQKNRPIYDFSVPLTEALNVVRISIKELTPYEEGVAQKRVKGDASRYLPEQVKACIIEVEWRKEGELVEEVRDADGDSTGKFTGTIAEPIVAGEQNIETVWKKLGPKGRALAMLAYNEIHVPSDAGTAVFLKGRRVRTS